MSSSDENVICSIYAIRSPSTPKYYIGSTSLKLSKRFSIHQYQYKQYQLNKFNFITSFEILKYNDCFIELIEEYECETKKQLHQREGEHIRSHRKLTICHLVNKKIDGRTAQEYLHDNSEKIRLYQKQYRHINDVYYKNYMSNWLAEHPDYMKNYRTKIKPNLRTSV